MFSASNAPPAQTHSPDCGTIATCSVPVSESISKLELVTDAVGLDITAGDSDILISISELGGFLGLQSSCSEKLRASNAEFIAEL